MTLTPPAALPRVLTVSYWLYLAAAAVGLIGLVVGLVTLPAALGALHAGIVVNGQTLTSGEVAAARAGGIVFAVVSAVLAVVYAVVFVVFDRLMVRGRNWARIVLAVLAAVQVFGLGGGFGLGALHFLLGLAALILSFLPESNAFFRGTRGAGAGMPPGNH